LKYKTGLPRVRIAILFERCAHIKTSDCMPAKKNQGPPPEKVALFDKLIATIPEIERKGDTNPYTSHNGNMFTHLTPDGIFSIRLSEKDLEAFIKKYKTKLLEIYGITKKDFAVVPDDLLKKTNELKPYLQKSFDHVKTLKPKPTTKTKKR